MPADVEGRASGMWRDRMARERAVLVLDNAASSAQVTPLLPERPCCLVLVPSRPHLADLPWPPGHPGAPCRDPGDDEAVRMFTRPGPQGRG